MENPVDLKLSGLGKASGGKFGSVNISGFGELTGSVEADTIQIAGAGSIAGNAQTDKIQVNGTGTINGDLEAHYIESTGNFTVKGQVRTDEWFSEGRGRVNGSLEAQKILAQGYLSVGAGVSCTNFYAKGSLTIEGGLKAETAEIEISGSCAAGTIEGTDILIRKQKNLNLKGLAKFVNPLLGNKREWEKLKCAEISGSHVEIEYVDAQTVRGDKLKIGADCHVEEVLYRDELEIEPSAWVGKQTKIENTDQI